MLSIALLLAAAVDLAEVFVHDYAWDRSIAKYENYCRGNAVSWRSTPVFDTRWVPEGNGVGRVELSLYNRGDAKAPLDEASLKQWIMRDFPGLDPARAAKRKLKSGSFQYECAYSGKRPYAEVSWGISNGTVDYYRVAIVRELKRSAPGKSVSGQAAKAKVSANVRKDPSGDVWIENLPMVDQGAKGYCAVATCERVLRYYGRNVDEHQLAQMAGTTAIGGTSIASMKETARAIGSKFRLGYNDIFSSTASFKDAMKDIELYNKTAKAMKRPELDLGRFRIGERVSIPMARAAMEKDVRLQMRSRDPRFKKFLTLVKSRIDEGIPVFWGVTLGIFPEPDIPQASGGHMRLIIGYNQKTHELIFSDSWGPGHEKKRMAEDVAFAITHDAFTLRPL